MSNHFLEALDGGFNSHKVNYIKGEMQADVFPPIKKEEDEFIKEIAALLYPSEMEREPGYYWVQLDIDDREEWIVAEWYEFIEDDNFEWRIPGEDDGFEDSYFKEIDPEQIVRKHPKY